MSEEQTFLDLMRRVRAGDQAACAELVREYGPHIRRAARLRLPARLAAVCDGSDVCQAVFGGFFVRVGLGQYDLQAPGQLVRLLCTMARNKALKRVGREYAERRDARRRDGGPVEEREVADPGPSPSQQVVYRELIEKAHALLSSAEKQVTELLSRGHTWAEVAARLGGTPEAVRKRHERALKEVARQLGLD
jgi:RNA polymerase sigma factor (sigma-70 family)